MSAIGKLLGILAVGKTISSSRSLFQQLLSGVAAVVMLSLITAMLIGALLLGGIYFSFYGLVAEGLNPQTAAMLLGGVVLLLVLIFAVATISCVRKLRDLPGQLAYMEAPITHRISHGISHAADSFLDGLLNRPAVRKR